MKWSEGLEIAIQLADLHLEKKKKTVRFTDLHNWVVALPEFDDDHSRGGEKVLEAIQQAWIDEVD